jgi:2-keto-4-pentenoate hydratase/2-oxohepta-3-ene-1,7-dioic acid hydratase in catechol pathway
VHEILEDFARHDGSAAERVREVLPDAAASWAALIERWDEVRSPLAALTEWAEGEGLGRSGSASAPPPLADPAVGIFAIGANFATHAAQAQFAMDGGGDAVDARVAALLANRRDGVPPWGFTILPRTVSGPGEAIGRPRGAELLDYEGEVAAVLRRAPSGAISVWGVAVFDDVSVRDPHFRTGPRIDEGPITWVLQKNFRGGSALGPEVVVDEDLDLGDLAIVTRVNGEVRQRGNTGEMVYGFDDVAAYLDRCVPLRSGDVLASGTPAGTAFEAGREGQYLQDGDLVEIEVTGVGVLANRVVATERTGAHPVADAAARS